MNLKQYLSEGRGRQALLAKSLGAHAPDVSRWADGSRPIPVAYGAQIEMATEGKVTRREMFPDDWQDIWPELIGESGNKSNAGSKRGSRHVHAASDVDKLK